MYLIFALISSICAALSSILSKIGLSGIDSNLATAIRTSVVFIMAWFIVFVDHKSAILSGISTKNLIFLILSGLLTGFSWLFYYKALQMGKVSKVIAIDKFSVVISLILVFIFLNEKLSLKSLLATIFISIGTLLMVL